VLVRHLAIPLVAPAAIVALYFTPVEVFGCVNRGLMAVAVALLSTGAACATTAIGARALARRDASSTRWLLSTLILLLPIALLVGPLG
jgi:hypothetical protein